MRVHQMGKAAIDAVAIIIIRPDILGQDHASQAWVAEVHGLAREGIGMLAAVHHRQYLEIAIALGEAGFDGLAHRRRSRGGNENGGAVHGADLKIRRLVPALGREGEDFNAIIRDTYRMFELRRQDLSRVTAVQPSPRTLTP